MTNVFHKQDLPADALCAVTTSDSFTTQYEKDDVGLTIDQLELIRTVSNATRIHDSHFTERLFKQSYAV